MLTSELLCIAKACANLMPSSSLFSNDDANSVLLTFEAYTSVPACAKAEGAHRKAEERHTAAAEREAALAAETQRLEAAARQVEAGAHLTPRV